MPNYIVSNYFVTSFRQANLTPGNLTARLINRDFRQATLTSISWDKVQNLHLVRGELLEFLLVNNISIAYYTAITAIANFKSFRSLTEKGYYILVLMS